MNARSIFFTFALAVSAGISFAQSDPGFRNGSGTVRPFAEPLYWLNSGSADRLPIRERPLTPVLGFAGLRPPQDTRQGWMPFGGFSLNHRSTSEESTNSETFAAIGAGLSYRHVGRRRQIDGNYFAEFTGADGAGGGLQNHGGALSYNYALSNRDNLSIFASYIRTTDLQTAPVQGSLSDATRFDTTSLVLSYGHAQSDRTSFETTFSGLLQSTDEASVNDARTYALSARVLHFVNPRNRLEAEVGLNAFDLGNNTYNMVHLDIGNTVDLGANLAASGSVGLMRTDADGGRTFGRLGAGLVTTAKNSRLALDYERDIISVPGIGNPLLSDRISAEWDYRISDGLISKVSLEESRLEGLSALGDTTRVFSLEGQVSHAVNNKLWLWMQVSLTNERAQGERTRDQRISFGISTNLR